MFALTFMFNKNDSSVQLGFSAKLMLISACRFTNTRFLHLPTITRYTTLTPHSVFVCIYMFLCVLSILKLILQDYKLLKLLLLSETANFEWSGQLINKDRNLKNEKCTQNGEKHSKSLTCLLFQPFSIRLTGLTQH